MWDTNGKDTVEIGRLHAHGKDLVPVAMGRFHAHGKDSVHTGDTQER